MSAPARRRAQRKHAAAKKNRPSSKIRFTESAGTPAWVPCDCGEWLCTIHNRLHAFDCSCPAIEDWPEGVSPYTTPMTDAQKRAARESNP